MMRADLRHAIGAATLLLATWPLSAGAQDAPAPQENAQDVTFDAALARLDTTSPGLAGEEHSVRASELLADATRTLRRPTVTASASLIEYQKTLGVDISGPRDNAENAASDFLTQLPGQFPPGLQQIVGDVTQRFGAALPAIFGQIPDTFEFQTRDTVFRPTISAAMPIYTGGAIGAVQDGADAAVGVARAKQAGGRDLSRVNLVKTYFGQQVAVQLARSTRETLESFDRHLSDAIKLEENGFIPHARVLQVQVARDAAQRAYERARLEEAIATDALARLLDHPGDISAVTPLFVRSMPLSPVETFLASVDSTPQVRGGDAAYEIADAGVDLAKSRYLPQAFAFGSYNANRDNAVPIDPDWIAGVTLRFTLMSGFDRRKTLQAALARERAAAEAAAQSRKDVTGQIVRAWNLVEAARRSFLLLDSNLAAARENLRVQQLSFAAGEAPSSALVDAEAILATTKTQRIAAAYEYDLALAGLLAASHRVDEFGTFLARADRRLEDYK
ncbi:TolC family protein [Altericroceibacterium endophyticum]|uniref:TolC family protein n=1 Tax=Altericroceibacterium endophyticum TaxID=1808508 RepID=A0A6I4T3G0_9SPHN|nr:TolC family protein [Altericroceibacterium endophyticum]MXO64799.1 TolC family protein [Altericroceibacterium endophyticum]